MSAQDPADNPKTDPKEKTMADLIALLPGTRLDAASADAAHQLLPAPGRDAYLLWLSAWRAVLARTVGEIRAAKARRMDRSLPTPARNAAQLERQRLRARAHNLLELRLAARRSARDRLRGASA